MKSLEYISNKLCHFVGRALQTDEDRFELLVKIVKGGKLFANMLNPDNPEVLLNFRYIGQRAGEVYEKIDCVCFCDIPDNALDIHTRKYGRFGIGFNKHYLATKGAHPVMYIPMNCDIKEISSTELPKNPIDYFNVLSKEYTTMSYFLSMVNQFYPYTTALGNFKLSDLAPYINLMNTDVVNAIQNNKSHQMLFSQMIAITGLMSYIKLFDETLSQDDENNYYMEREWRILSSVEFDLDNIDKIYLPHKEYENYFMSEFPKYRGEFYVF